MGFGVIANRRKEYTFYLDTGNGFKLVKGSQTITNPARISGYITERKVINLFMNGILSNSAFTITYRSNKVEFQYNGDASLFSKPVLLSMEIEQ